MSNKCPKCRQNSAFLHREIHFLRPYAIIYKLFAERGYRERLSKSLKSCEKLLSHHTHPLNCRCESAAFQAANTCYTSTHERKAVCLSNLLATWLWTRSVYFSPLRSWVVNRSEKWNKTALNLYFILLFLTLWDKKCNSWFKSKGIRRCERNFNAITG